LGPDAFAVFEIHTVYLLSEAFFHLYFPLEKERRFERKKLTPTFQWR
jgi:hypothetical protein